MCFAEEDICGFLMEDDYFTPVFQIAVVDETSVCRLHGFHFCVVRVYAQQGDIDIFLSKTDVYIALAYCGTGTNDIFCKLLFRVCLLYTSDAADD